MIIQETAITDSAEDIAMNEKDAREVLQFLTPPAAVTIVGAVFILLSPAVYFVLNALSSKPLLAPVAGATTAVMGLVFILVKYYYRSMAKNCIKEAAEKGSFAKMLSDFRSGDRLLGGRMIFGERFIFSKGLGVVVYCEDIAELRRVTKRYRAAPVSENIIVRLKNNKKMTLCSISNMENTNQISDVLYLAAQRLPDAIIR